MILDLNVVNLNDQEEKMEDACDLKAISAYEESLKNNEIKYISLDEIRRKLRL